jgi:hypothetical protein
MIPANVSGGALVYFRDETAQHGGCFNLAHGWVLRQSLLEVWQLTGLNIQEKEAWSFVGQGLGDGAPQVSVNLTHRS